MRLECLINGNPRTENPRPNESYLYAAARSHQVKDQTTIATRKLTRSVITGAAATKIGAKHLSYMGKRALTKKEDREQLQEQHNRDLGKLLFAALSQLRGTALKASQILSTEASFLPKSIRDELGRACYQVPPINRALIRKVFIQQFQCAPEQLFAEFNSDAFAAASIGQVHDARTNNNESVAVKIQYPGIAASIDSDVRLMQGVLNTLSSALAFIPSKAAVEHTLNEVKERLQEEVDYQREADHTEWFRQRLDKNEYCVPRVFSEFSSNRVLTTEKLSGQHIDEWLNNNPDQDARNNFGQLLFNYFIYSNFELKCINPDFHPGNFLMMDDGRLGILDFGCVKKFDDEYPNIVSKLFSTFKRCHYNLDMKELMAAYQNLGLIKPDLEEEIFAQDIYPSCKLIIDWFIEPFLHSTFNFKNKMPYPAEIHKEGKKTAKHLHLLKEEQMSFDRGYLGLMNLLTRLEAEIVTTNQWL